MSLKDYVWACDPIGSLLFVSSATLMLLALDWAGGAYRWSDPHVAGPLTVGLVLLLCFALYGKHHRVGHEKVGTEHLQNGKGDRMDWWLTYSSIRM